MIDVSMGMAGRRGFTAALGALMLAGICAGHARAQGAAAGTRLPAPTGPVLLTITGNVSLGQKPGQAQFDREMLGALPQRRIDTSTPWAQGVRTYEGPLLRDVLAAAGAAGRKLVARALNDYSATVPRADADGLGLVLATRVDGQAIRTRDNGPLLLIYPFDQRPELRNQVYYGRSVWQLNVIAVDD